VRGARVSPKNAAERGPAQPRTPAECNPASAVARIEGGSALLFRSNDGGGRGFGQRILYASHFLDAPRNGCPFRKSYPDVMMV